MQSLQFHLIWLFWCLIRSYESNLRRNDDPVLLSSTLVIRLIALVVVLGGGCWVCCLLGRFYEHAVALEFSRVWIRRKFYIDVEFCRFIWYCSSDCSYSYHGLQASKDQLFRHKYMLLEKCLGVNNIDLSVYPSAHRAHPSTASFPGDIKMTLPDSTKNRSLGDHVIQKQLLNSAKIL